MAEHDESQDPRVSAGYRALGEDNPPQALDAAILAASRRAVGAGPRRAGFSLRRWALPVSVAAIVVLTMSLVVRVQLERPDLETGMPIPAAPPLAEKKAAARDAKDESDALAKHDERLEAQPKTKASAAPPAASERERERASVARQAVPAAPAAKPAPRFVPEPQSAPAPAPAESAAQPSVGAASAEPPAAAPSAAGARADRPTSEDAQGGGRLSLRAPPEDRAPASAEMAGKKDESPREWLERIARLRREGRAKEADDSLAEFRRRHPDYEIPKEMREAVLGEPPR